MRKPFPLLNCNVSLHDALLLERKEHQQGQLQPVQTLFSECFQIASFRHYLVDTFGVRHRPCSLSRKMDCFHSQGVSRDPTPNKDSTRLQGLRNVHSRAHISRLFSRHELLVVTGVHTLPRVPYNKSNCTKDTETDGNFQRLLL
jgi:hypothetical protein